MKMTVNITYPAWWFDATDEQERLRAHINTIYYDLYGECPIGGIMPPRALLRKFWAELQDHLFEQLAVNGRMMVLAGRRLGHE